MRTKTPCQHVAAGATQPCGRPGYARKLCVVHWKRSQRQQPMDKPIRPPQKHRRGVCLGDDCSRPILARELCRSHYRRRFLQKREDWAKPIGLHRRGTVRTSGTWVKRATQAAILKRAQSQGLTCHAMTAAILDTWADTLAVPLEKWRRGA